jgi:hypothetical protein
LFDARISLVGLAADGMWIDSGISAAQTSAGTSGSGFSIVWNGSQRGCEAI